jgi:hypothetical protein
VFQNEHVHLVVALEELKVELHGFLPGKDISKVVVDFF